jgi:hypothetical protein
MVTNRAKHNLVFVHEVPVRYAETIRKPVLSKYVLGDSSRRLGKCRSIALLRPIVDTGFY